MTIQGLILLENIVEKLAVKHHVSQVEVEAVFNRRTAIRQAQNRSRCHLKIFTSAADKTGSNYYFAGNSS